MSSSKNLEFEKSGFLSKSNSAFIEQMYLQYLNNDPNLPKSWKDYFNEIGDEADIIIKEINGPSWNPKKNKASIKKFSISFIFEYSLLITPFKKIFLSYSSFLKP